MVLQITLSVKSHQELSTAWRNHKSVRDRFFANGWLSKRSAGWFRETELTVSGAGWHLHDHVLVFFESTDKEAALQLGNEAVLRWLVAAGREGVAASKLGQHLRTTENVHRQLLYVTKGLMVQKRDVSANHGYSPADVLALWQVGDVRGAEWWAELEQFFNAPHRWKGRGGPASKPLIE